MIKKHINITLLLFLTFIASCADNKNDTKTQNKVETHDSVDFIEPDPLFLLELSEAEAYYLNKYPNISRRIDDTLFVYLKNGNVLSYINSNIDTDRQRIYEFHGAIVDLPYLIFTTLYYENHTVLVLHDSLGIEYEFEDRPYLSPDKKHFVISYNNEIDKIFNLTQIWRIERDSLVLEHEAMIDSSATSELKWDSNNSFKYLLQNSFSKKIDTIEMVQTNGDWRSML